MLDEPSRRNRAAEKMLPSIRCWPPMLTPRPMSAKMDPDERPVDEGTL